MAKLILKSIAYYPVALAELPMSHKDLGVIDTDKPYKKLLITAQSRQLYRLVDQQTGQLLKAQKLIRDHNDLKVYVGEVVALELKDFFSFENATLVKAEQEPLYMVDTGEVSCVNGLISPTDGMHLPNMYVLWEPGMPVEACLNPNAMALVPMAGLGGISGMTAGSAIAISSALGAVVAQASLINGAQTLGLPQFGGYVFAGPVVGTAVEGLDGKKISVSGLKVQAFDASGNLLATTDVHGDGSYELQLPNTYRGALLLKVFDPDDAITAQYIDETTQKPKKFGTLNLLAVINYQGDTSKTATVNITTLTNLAAIKAGAKVSGDTVFVPATDAIETANAQVAQKFIPGINSLQDSQVLPTIKLNQDGSVEQSKGNGYGIALALLSQIENISGLTTAQVADLLAPALTASSGNSKAIINYLNQASANLINNGVDANTLQTMVNGLGNALATGSVSLSSNASPAVNLSTNAPAENSKLTATVSNFQDANNSKKIFTNPNTYQWQSSTDGLIWTNIDNAKAKDFLLTQAQVGKKVRALIKNSDEAGFDEFLISAATLAVKNVNQEPAGSISIGVSNNGELKQGSLMNIISNTLTDTDGMGTLSYQWQSGSNVDSRWTDIQGATADTYQLTQAEVGKQVRLKASYTDGQGTPETVFSAATTAAGVGNVNDLPQGDVLINRQTGSNLSYQQGDLLQATNTLIDPDNNGDAITGVSYQWQRSSDGNNWTNISNATLATYTLAQADVGQYIRVLASYTDKGNFSNSQTSAATSVITDANDAPSGSLTISGSATENQTLSATANLSDPDNNGAAISGMTYQWEQADTANGTWQAIADTNRTTFTPGNAQVGKYLRVTVSYVDTGGNRGGYSNSFSSAATDAVQNINDKPIGTVSVRDLNDAAPDYTQNAVLKASNNLQDADGMGTVSYKWQNSANGTDWNDISGANTDSYTLTQADVGKYVHVRASYTDKHDTLEIKDSSYGARVANVNDPPIGTVTVTGALTQGTRLQAANTLDDADGMGVVAYQWQVSINNSDWSDIANAIGSSFLLTQAQTGQYVRVKASYTDGFGYTETVVNDTRNNTVVLDVMEAPVLSLTTANQTFTEKTGPNQQANVVTGVFTNVNLSDAENNLIVSISFSVSGLKNGADEKLWINNIAVPLTVSQPGAELSSGVGLTVVMSNNSTATVTLSKSGGWTLAETQNLINSIGYQNTNTDDPGPGDRSIALLQLVDNGIPGNADDKNTAAFSAAKGNAIAATVTVQAVNDPPVLSGQPQTSALFTENGSAVTVNAAINISDVDSTKLFSAKVTIHAAGYVTGDTLSLPAGLSGIGNISASAFDASTRTLTLTSASGDSPAEWQHALSAVMFISTSDNPGSSRSISFTVNDGTDNSEPLVSTVTVTPVNDAPLLTLTANPKTFTEGAGLNNPGNAVTHIFTAATVTDAENNNITSITLTVSNVLDGSNEVLLVDGKTIALGSTAANTPLSSTYGLSYTQTWDSGSKITTIVLSKASGLTLAETQSVIQSIGYQNTNTDNPSPGVRSIALTQITDAGSNASPNVNTSSYSSFNADITVQAINDAPVLSSQSPTTPVFIENGSAVTVNAAINISDADTSLLKSAVITITSGFVSGDSLNLTLNASTMGDISVTAFDAASKQLVLSSNNGASFTQWQNALRAVMFISTSDNPGSSRNISFTVNDGSDNSAALVSTVTVTPVNDAPVLTLTANAKTFTEGSNANPGSSQSVQGAAVTGVFTSANLTDAENDNIFSITLTVSNVLDGSNEVLLVDGKTIALGSDVATATALTSSNGLSYTQTWNSGSKLATIVLSKAGGLTLAETQSVIQSIGYQNTNTDNPSPGVRSIALTQITDAGSNASPNVNTSSYSSFNADITVQAINDLPVNTVPANTLYANINSFAYLNGLSVADADSGAATIRLTLTVTKGILDLITSVAGLTPSNNGTASVTLSGTESAIRTLLTTSNAVKYTPSSNYFGPDSLTMVANDGSTDVSSVAVINVNQLPVILAPSTRLATVNENSEIEITADMLRVHTHATDPEDSSVNAFVVTAITTGSVRIGADSASATAWNASTNAVVDSTHKLYWKAVQDDNGSSLNAFLVAAKDSAGAVSVNAVQISLDVTPVNSAPVFTNAPTSTPVSTPMNTAYALPTGYRVNDVDAGSSAVLKLSFTLKEGASASGSLAYDLGSSGVTWFSSSGNVYTFQGTLSQLNTWMATTGFLTYSPSSAFMGNATVTLAINDQGNTGSGSAITTTATNALTINVKDVTPPVLTSISTDATGSKIVLTFNEALSSTTAAAANFRYSLNGSGSYTPASVTVNGSTVELNLTANKPVFRDTFSVDYSAPVSDLLPTNSAVQDTSGNDAIAISNNNGLTPSNIVANIVPTLSITPVTHLIPNTAFTVNGSSSNVTAVNVNGRTVELNLAAGVNIASAITLTYANTNTSKAIQDTTGNDAAGIASIASPLNIPVAGYTAPSETLAPTLISAVLSADRKTVTLTYSESLDTTKPLVPGNFTVFAATDYTVSSPTSYAVSSAVVNASNPNTVVLTLSAASGIPANMPFVAATYAPPTPAVNTLANSVVQDPTGNDAAGFTKLPVPTTNVDSVLPVLRTVAVSSSSGVNKLILTYSEALNNASNFTEGNNSAQGSAVYVFNSATANAGTGESTQSITGLSFTVSGLKDGADEKITVDGSTFALTNGTSGTTSNIAPNNAMTYNVSVSGSTATVTLTKAAGITATQAQSLLTGMTYQNTNVDNPTPGLRVFDIASITDNSGAANATSTFAAGTNSSSVLVTALNDPPYFSTSTVATGLNTTNSQAAAKAINIPMNGFVIADRDGGNTIETLSFTMTDFVAPPLVTPTYAPVNLNFPVGATSLYATRVSDYSYSVYGTVADLNNWLQQTNAMSYNPRVGFVGTAKLSTLRIRDSFGGFADSGTPTATTNITVTADTQAPLLRSAVLEGTNKIILNFDEPLNTTPANLPPSTAFTVGGSTVSAVAVVGSSVILTTSSNVSSGVAVTYNDPGGSTGIQDAAGVHAITQTVNAISDSVAPVLSGSMVYYNGSGSALNKFVLNFNEDMSSVCASANQFSVYIADPVYPDRTGSVNPISTTMLSGGNSNYGNNTVTFGINVNFLSPNASVSITYTDATAGNDTSAIQDVAGNDVPNMVLGAWTNDILTASTASFTAGKSVLVVGGQGNDTMTGGAANDTFVWFAGDAGATGAVDIVKSFSPWTSATAKGDKIDISKLLTNGFVSATSTLSEWVTSITTAQTSPGGVANSTKIVIDVDGQPAVGAGANAPGTSTVTQTIWLEGVNLTLSGATLDAQLTALKNSGVLIA